MKTSRILLGALVYAALLSCKGGGAAPTGTNTIQVLINPSSVAILPGDTVRLHAVVTGPPGISQAVTWLSLNTAIATINGSGLVTAIAEGTTSIRARWAPDPEEWGTIEVLVTLTQIPDALRAGVRVGRPAP